MLRSIFPHVTYQEYKEKKVREHEHRMRECTETDAVLDAHPYKDFIPQ